MGLREDLDLIFSDSALEPVSVRVAGVTTQAYFDDADAVVGGIGSGLEPGETAQLDARVVQIRTGTLPGLARHVTVELTDPLTKVTTTYKARNVVAIDDGLLTFVWLVLP